jgi:nitrite reductase/ring-hydroxylating ferredoxin subunit
MEQWFRVCKCDDIPSSGVKIVRAGPTDVALFRNGARRIIALAVANGAVVAPGHGRAVTFEVRLESDGSVLLRLGARSC